MTAGRILYIVMLKQHQYAQKNRLVTWGGLLSVNEYFKVPLLLRHL